MMRNNTAMAILEHVNNIYHGFENNQYTVGVFIDRILRKHLIQWTMKYFWIN